MVTASSDHASTSDRLSEKALTGGVDGEGDEAVRRRRSLGLRLSRRWRNDDDLVLAYQAEHRSRPLIQHIGIERLGTQQVGLMRQSLTGATDLGELRLSRFDFLLKLDP